MGLSDKPVMKSFDEVLGEFRARNEKWTQSEVAMLAEMYERVRSSYVHVSTWGEGEVLNWVRSVKGKERYEPSALAEAIAVAGRANNLLTGHSLRDTQILTLIVLLRSDHRGDKGMLVQVDTGEGKSTICAILAALKALSVNYVDVVTSSPMLAKRDAEDEAEFFKLFGLTVSHNTGHEETIRYRECYKANIVYGNTDSFMGDILRHEFKNKNVRGNRPFNCVIVDEVDSMFIDDNTSAHILMLTFNCPGMEWLLPLQAVAWNGLCDIYSRLERGSSGEWILECGAQDGDKGGGVEDCLSDKRLIPGGDICRFMKQYMKDALESAIELNIAIPVHLRGYAQDQFNKWADSAVQALFCFTENISYVVRKEEEKMAVTPVDYVNTGVLEENMHLSNGLHTFLQLMHGTSLKPESLTTSFMSNLAFYARYGSRLYGLTGTLGSAEAQRLLHYLYPVDLAIIPRYCEKRYKKVEGLLARDRHQWMEFIEASVLAAVRKGRAVLIINETIKDAEDINNQLICAMEDGLAPRDMVVHFYKRNDVDEEMAIVKRPLRAGDVIDATNLAGRGTDLKVNAKGGLYVCLTFLPRNSRIQLQAEGRTARQGQPGESQLILNWREVKVQLERAQQLPLFELSNVADLERIRDGEERNELRNFKQTTLMQIRTKDELFTRFSAFYVEQLRRFEKKDTVMQQLEERWGILLERIEDRYFSDMDKIRALSGGMSASRSEWVLDEGIAREFDSFLSSMRGELNSLSSFFRNPCYAVGYAWESGQKQDWPTAIEFCTTAAELDQNFAFPGLYYRALAYIQQDYRNKRKERQLQAIGDLHQAHALIEQLIPCLVYIQSTVRAQSAVSVKSDLAKQQLTKIKLLRELQEHIQKSALLIEKCPEEKYPVLKRYIDLSEKHPNREAKDEINELSCFGIRSFYELEYVDPPKPWGAIFLLALLGVGQIALGAACAACGLFTLSKNLIHHGVNDIIEAIKVGFGKAWEGWKTFWIKKAFDFAISFFGNLAMKLVEKLPAFARFTEQISQKWTKTKQWVQEKIGKVEEFFGLKPTVESASGQVNSALSGGLGRSAIDPTGMRPLQFVCTTIMQEPDVQRVQSLLKFSKPEELVRNSLEIATALGVEVPKEMTALSKIAAAPDAFLKNPFAVAKEAGIPVPNSVLVVTELVKDPQKFIKKPAELVRRLEIAVPEQVEMFLDILGDIDKLALERNPVAVARRFCVFLPPEVGTVVECVLNPERIRNDLPGCLKAMGVEIPAQMEKVLNTFAKIDEETMKNPTKLVEQMIACGIDCELLPPEVTIVAELVSDPKKLLNDPLSAAKRLGVEVPLELESALGWLQCPAKLLADPVAAAEQLGVKVPSEVARFINYLRRPKLLVRALKKDVNALASELSTSLDVLLQYRVDPGIIVKQLKENPVALAEQLGLVIPPDTVAIIDAIRNPKALNANPGGLLRALSARLPVEAEGLRKLLGVIGQPPEQIAQQLTELLRPDVGELTKFLLDANALRDEPAEWLKRLSVPIPGEFEMLAKCIASRNRPMDSSWQEIINAAMVSDTLPPSLNKALEMIGSAEEIISQPIMLAKTVNLPLPAEVETALGWMRDPRQLSDNPIDAIWQLGLAEVPDEIKTFLQRALDPSALLKSFSANPIRACEELGFESTAPLRQLAELLGDSPSFSNRLASLAKDLERVEKENIARVNDEVDKRTGPLKKSVESLAGTAVRLVEQCPHQVESVIKELADSFTQCVSAKWSNSNFRTNLQHYGADLWPVGHLLREEMRLLDVKLSQLCEQISSCLNRSGNISLSPMAQFRSSINDLVDTTCSHCEMALANMKGWGQVPSIEDFIAACFVDHDQEFIDFVVNRLREAGINYNSAWCDTITDVQVGRFGGEGREGNVKHVVTRMMECGQEVAEFEKQVSRFLVGRCETLIEDAVNIVMAEKLIFFRNNVQSNFQPRCTHGDACPITKSTRNRCRSCRFQKCIDAGMLRGWEALGHSSKHSAGQRQPSHSGGLNMLQRYHSLPIVSTPLESNQCSRHQWTTTSPIPSNSLGQRSESGTSRYSIHSVVTSDSGLNSQTEPSQESLTNAVSASSQSQKAAVEPPSDAYDPFRQHSASPAISLGDEELSLHRRLSHGGNLSSWLPPCSSAASGDGHPEFDDNSSAVNVMLSDTRPDSPVGHDEDELEGGNEGYIAEELDVFGDHASPSTMNDILAACESSPNAQQQSDPSKLERMISFQESTYVSVDSSTTDLHSGIDRQSQRSRKILTSAVLTSGQNGSVRVLMPKRPSAAPISQGGSRNPKKSRVPGRANIACTIFDKSYASTTTRPQSVQWANTPRPSGRKIPDPAEIARYGVHEVATLLGRLIDRESVDVMVRQKIDGHVLQVLTDQGIRDLKLLKGPEAKLMNFLGWLGNTNFFYVCPPAFSNS